MQVPRISFLSFMLLLSFSSGLYAATPYFNIRSQSAHLPLDMVGQEAYLNRVNASGNYTDLSFAAAFSQSFRNNDIACCLFGPHLTKCGDKHQLNISGSTASDRGSNDWLADYFGLPTDFKSAVTFSPRIRNVVVDANFYWGLDEWLYPGVYFRMHAPFVHTRWDLGFCEKVSNAGTANHPAGYFNSNGADPGVTRSKLLNSFEEFAVQCKTPDVNPTINLALATADPMLTQITFEALSNARMAGCNCAPLTRSGIADVRFALGYNVYMGDTYHVGFGLAGAAPTGNRPHGEFVFEPMVGNSNHWEVGGQITAHYQFWKSEDEQKSLTGYLEANLTHMFSTRQTRTFDLKGKPNSRYMLAQKMGTPTYLLQFTPTGDVTQVVSAPLIPAQFKDVFTPVANLSTVDVDVNVGAHIDMALMLNYTTNNLVFDFGYNLWARTCERIKLNCDCPNRLTDGQSWALKGDAHVYGFTRATPFYAVPLSATQSSATILLGANKGAATTSTTAERNPGVDAAQRAAINNTTYLYPTNTTAAGAGNAIFTSKDPVFITTNDLDFDAAATKGLSHTLFGSFSYQWLHKDGYVPFLGVGVSAEFLNASADCCTAKTNSAKDCGSGCNRCGISQWSVWIKGGFSFE